MNPFDRLVLDEPPLGLTVDGLVARGRARARRQRIAAVTGAAVAAGVVALVVPAVLDASKEPDRLASQEPRFAPPVASPSQASPSLERPSQSAADARRDGVLREVAALPFAERVRILQRATAPEGVWAVSRMPLGPDASDALGDTTGRYGTDYVSRVEYGELLLLDATGTRIVRAYPLPGVPPQTLLLHDAAVYCARQGDGGLPVSMLCRVDRHRLDLTVRVFPNGSVAPVPDDSFPQGWLRDPGTPPNLFDAVIRCGSRLCAQGQQGTAPIDPLTLAILR